MTKENRQKCCAKKGIFGIVILLIAISVFIVWNKAPVIQSSDHYGTWFDAPQPVKPFTLESTQGKNFTEKSFEGHWSWVFFGFSSCPDMCPNTMKAFKVALAQLKKDNVTLLPEVVFVSIDPKRDTLAVLRQYVKAFDPSFIGLVGPISQVEILARQMNVSFKDMGNGMIQHSGTVTVINPQGEIQAYFPWMDEPKKVAADYELMLNSHSTS